MMKFLPLFVAVFVLSGTAKAANDDVLNMLVQKEQQLADAIAVGRKAIWKDALHETCLITLEDGKQVKRDAFLEDLKPLPSHFKGSIKVIEPALQLVDNTAVLTFIYDERLELYGQTIHTRYRQTGTWMKMKDGWKMIALQVFEIPKNPAPVSFPAAVLNKYTGTYQVDKDHQSIVTLKNGRLFAQKSDRDPVELLAETENVFFREGDGRVRVIFLREPGGEKYRMVERRAGEDLVWRQGGLSGYGRLGISSPAITAGRALNCASTRCTFLKFS